MTHHIRNAGTAQGSGSPKPQRAGWLPAGCKNLTRKVERFINRQIDRLLFGYVQPWLEKHMK